MKKLTYKQAYIKCLDIVSEEAIKADKAGTLSEWEIIWEMYQKMGALMLRLPREGK